jgi:hypothetical protein
MQAQQQSLFDFANEKASDKSEAFCICGMFSMREPSFGAHRSACSIHLHLRHDHRVDNVDDAIVSRDIGFDNVCVVYFDLAAINGDFQA